MGTTASRMTILGGLAVVLLVLFFGIALGGAGFSEETNVLLSTVWSVQKPWEVFFWVTFTSLGAWYTLFGIVLVFAYLLERTARRFYAYLLISMFIVAEFVGIVAKELFGTARPDEVWVATTGPGFPSGHSLAAFAIFGALGILVWGADLSREMKKWLSGISIAIIILVGLSRITLGAHYPNDVLAGWLLGGVLVSLFYFMHRVSGLFGVKKGKPVKKDLVIKAGLVALLVAVAGMSFDLVRLVIG